MGEKQEQKQPVLQHISWQDMVEEASKQRLMKLNGGQDSESPSAKDAPYSSSGAEPAQQPKTNANAITKMNPELRLALYIAMAHGGLILALAGLYGLAKLLQEFRTPIQWALLCSMPLREVQSWLVEFWTEPLTLGLMPTLLAIPLAIFNAMAATFHDLVSAIEPLTWKNKKKKVNGHQLPRQQEQGFSKLMRWMLSFGVFVLSYERLGSAAWAILLFLGFVIYAARRTLEMEDMEGESLMEKSKSQLKRKMRINWEKGGAGVIPVYTRFNRRFRQMILKRLNFVVAVFLITGMIVGSVAGLLLFSYKMGVEGKDAVVSVKNYVQQSDYVGMGLKQWIDDKNIGHMMDTYTLRIYDTISSQLDEIADTYNLTDLVQSFKHYLLGSQSDKSHQLHSPALQPTPHPITQTLQSIRLNIVKGNFRSVYTDIESLLRDMSKTVFPQFQISREELQEKARKLAYHGLEVSKRLYQSGALLLTSGGSLVFYMGVSIATGAVEIMNFLSQSMVFFWLLYYMITSEPGGVMDHVVSMMPISNPTRKRCAKVLQEAVSSVLLATAKVAFFQATVTWFLFRFFQIHFVYMSTMLAFVNAVLPIFPSFVSSLPALVQLLIEGQYIQSILLTIVHLWIMDYGTAAINADIPGCDSYLTGLSIIGGMALFSSALEGAIMGPLILTFMLALRNLYCEFILVALEDAGSQG